MIVLLSEDSLQLFSGRFFFLYKRQLQCALCCCSRMLSPLREKRPLSHTDSHSGFLVTARQGRGMTSALRTGGDARQRDDSVCVKTDARSWEFSTCCLRLYIALISVVVVLLRPQSCTATQRSRSSPWTETTLRRTSEVMVKWKCYPVWQYHCLKVRKRYRDPRRGFDA